METLTEQREGNRREKEGIGEEEEEAKKLIVESESPLTGPPTVVIMPTRRYQAGGNTSV